MSEELLTVIEAAKKLGVSPRTIQRYCKQSRLNHKWVMGKRHKELRILSPIPISQLPGGRRRNLVSTFDYITKDDFEAVIAELNRILDDKDTRITLLEEKTAQLKSQLQDQGNTDLRVQIKEFLHEAERVRPAEAKLILKLAQEITAHKEYHDSLDTKVSEHDRRNSE